MHPKLKAVLDLGRVSNLPSVWTNALAAWLLSGGGDYFLRCFPLLIGASLLYMAGTTLNDAFDANFDREHRPERPIPSGVLSSAQVWIIAIAEMAVGALLLAFLANVYLPWIAGLVAAIVVYDLLHKKWQGSIWVMGACRFLLFLTGASAGVVYGPGLDIDVLIWATALLAYVAGLSLVARGESTGRGAGNKGLALLAAPVAAWLAAIILTQVTLPAVLALFAFVGWTIFSFVELRRAGKESDEEPESPPVARFVTRLLAGIILIDAMVVSFAASWLFLAFAAVVPFTLQLQRRFAAT